MLELMQPHWQQVSRDGNRGSIFSTSGPRQSALSAVNVTNLDIPASATLSAKFGLPIVPLRSRLCQMCQHWPNDGLWSHHHSETA